MYPVTDTQSNAAFSTFPGHQAQAEKCMAGTDILKGELVVCNTTIHYSGRIIVSTRSAQDPVYGVATHSATSGSAIVIAKRGHVDIKTSTSSTSIGIVVYANALADFDQCTVTQMAGQSLGVTVTPAGSGYEAGWVRVDLDIGDGGAALPYLEDTHDTSHLKTVQGYAMGWFDTGVGRNGHFWEGHQCLYTWMYNQSAFTTINAGELCSRVAGVGNVNRPYINVRASASRHVCGVALEAIGPLTWGRVGIWGPLDVKCVTVSGSIVVPLEANTVAPFHSCYYGWGNYQIGTNWSEMGGAYEAGWVRAFFNIHKG